MLRPRCIQVLLAFMMAASGLTLACRTLPDQSVTLKDTVLSLGDPRSVQKVTLRCCNQQSARQPSAHAVFLIDQNQFCYAFCMENLGQATDVADFD